MKKSLLNLVVLTAVVAMTQLPVLAEQTQPTSPNFFDKMHGNMEEKMQKHENEMNNKLNLSKEQKEQAKKIREEGRTKLAPIMQQMHTLRQQADTVRNENMAKFEAILTPQQKIQFQQIKKEMQEKREQRKNSCGPRS